MPHRPVEIMAPVGSWESLAAALNAGCHSVYFGVEQLNMRARSTLNFTLDDLPRIVERCAPRQVKTYITLNTILYDHDIALAKSIVDRAQQCGVTAVIAADHAVMNYCRRVKMPLHVSTQANVSNIDTVEFFSAFADVVVLARELTLRQVASLTKEIEKRQICGPSGHPIAIEMFVHGALCMAVSGKCYISLHSHNASANRGACVQNCRREYVVTDKEDGVELAIDNEYIMSAKDLCTIGFLDKIISSGVRILKIEGRGRSADYVHETVSCYREAVDAIQDGTFDEVRKQGWMKRLSTVYNRGFWDGYYLGQTIGEWNNTYGSKATEKKVYLGKGVKFYRKIGVGEFVLENHSLKKGDEIMVTGPTTGVMRVTVSEIRVDNVAVDEVGRDIPFSIPIDTAIRPSDKLYRISKSE